MVIEGADLAARRAGLFAVALSSFLTAFLISSLNVALPVLQKEFQLNAILLGWVPMASLLASAMFVVPLGRISDIYGRRRIFMYGMIIFTASSLLCSLSGSVTSLIPFMVIQGIGGAMIFGTNVAMLSSVFPPQERGRALGLNVAAVYIGGSAGPFLGGLLTQGAGWRSIFWVTAALALATLVVVLWKQRGEWRPARGEAFDPVGALLYSGLVFYTMDEA